MTLRAPPPTHTHNTQQALTLPPCTAPPPGHKKMNPFCIPFAITNMSGALLAMDLGFMGPNYTINTGARAPGGGGHAYARLGRQQFGGGACT